MARPKKTPIEPTVEQEQVATEESIAKQEFRAFIEKVKADHPAKYPQLEAELQAKLNQL